MSIIIRRAFNSCSRLCIREKESSVINQATTTAKHLVQQNKRGDSYRLTSFPDPTPLTPIQSRSASKLFAKPTRFLTSVFEPEKLPPYQKPEIAFVGRSNVGKSTLINRLTNNNKLVKTSSKPGHTKSLNFFDIANQITLVDMPGYGFQSREAWGDLILYYLQNRTQLKRLFIVIDPVAGIKETDKQIMQILDQQPLSYQVVLTKRDRLSKEAFEKSKSSIEDYLVNNAICCYPEILVTGKRRKSQKDSLEQTTQDITRVRWAVMSATGVASSSSSSSPTSS